MTKAIDFARGRQIAVAGVLSMFIGVGAAMAFDSGANGVGADPGADQRGLTDGPEDGRNLTPGAQIYDDDLAGPDVYERGDLAAPDLYEQDELYERSR